MILALVSLVAGAAGAAYGPVDHLHKIVVEAIRNCPTPVGDEIVVCAKDIGGAPPYRLPRLDPRYAERQAALATPRDLVGGTAGATGSCSATGAAGATGCALGAANAWGNWKKDAKADGRQFPW